MAKRKAVKKKTKPKKSAAARTKKTSRARAGAKKKRVHQMHGCRKCGKHWVGPADQFHVCIPPSEERVFEGADETLLEAWEKLREYAEALGEQRIYPSQKAVMFARRICYFFVHPKRTHLQLSIFLKKVPRHPLVHKSVASSKTRNCVIVRLTHEDQVEAPLTDWLREAFETCSG